MKDPDLLKKISEAFTTGDLEFCSSYLADDIQWNILGERSVIGKDQVLEVFKMQALESFPAITIKNVIQENDQVVIESVGKGRTKSGKPYDQTYCEIFRFDHELLQEVTTYLDTLVSKEALGL